MFLGFPNFNKRFIKKLNKIAALLISILQITNKSIANKPQSIRANTIKKNQNIPSDIDNRDI